MRVLIFAQFEGGGSFEVGLRDDALAVGSRGKFDACAHFVCLCIGSIVLLPVERWTIIGGVLLIVIVCLE